MAHIRAHRKVGRRNEEMKEIATNGGIKPTTTESSSLFCFFAVAHTICNNDDVDELIFSIGYMSKGKFAVKLT